MPNSRFGYSVKKNSFKGLNIDCIQYSNIIRITHYSYSYSGTILNPNIIRIRIRPNICARILFVFVFAHSEKTNIIRIRIRSKFWFRILFVFVFGPKNSIRSPLVSNHKLSMFLFQITSVLNFSRHDFLETHWKHIINEKNLKGGQNYCREVYKLISISSVQFCVIFVFLMIFTM